jgi:hypothetical protein
MATSITIAGNKNIRMDADHNHKKNQLEQREIILINNFIKRFLMNSQTSLGDHINLKMALKALPYFIDRHNLQKVDSINFQKVQQALIWFVNDDQDEMFNYYDSRNIQRIESISTTNHINEELINKILRSSAYLNSYFQYRDDSKHKGEVKSSSEFYFTGDEKGGGKKMKKKSTKQLPNV